MAFPRRLLTEGEQVVEEVRPHWSALGWALPALTVSLAGLLAVEVAWESAPAAVVLGLLGLVGLVALWLAGRGLRWWTTNLVVTTGRLVQRSGVVARRGIDVRLERINEISYQQSIVERLIGTGRLFVDVGGDRGLIGFDHVRHPAALASVVHEQIVALSGPTVADARRLAGSTESPGPVPPAAPHPGTVPHDTPPTGTALPGSPADRSVPQQLIELDELRRRGLLTEAEFAERRAKLLDRL
jgi:hypothetical protein